MNQTWDKQLLRKMQQWRSELPPQPRRETFVLREDLTNLKDLRVAAIMDPFTYNCFEPECQLLNLSFDSCLDEIDAFEPDLLFLETVWRGKEGKWRDKASRVDLKEMARLTGYCRSLGIPIVFWSKEDPVHMLYFLRVAQMADFVFTTDGDLLPLYRWVMGHDRVGHLHFGAQPKIHNPVETFDRKPQACFAGSYYHKYENRNRLLEIIFDYFSAHEGMEIYDRNYGSDVESKRFPEKFQPYIQGTLPPEKIDVAYKGYTYGVNLSTVTESTTMFARRVFELMASNTAVVSNYSLGSRNMFGDLMINEDEKERIQSRLKDFAGVKGEKTRLLALRRVMQEHLYVHRLDQVVKRVFGKSLKPPEPRVYVLDLSRNGEEKARVAQMFNSQSYPHKVLAAPQTWDTIPEDAFVACFNPRHYYAASFLTDLVLARQYSQAQGFVKPEGREQVYRPAREMLLSWGVVQKAFLKACPTEPDTRLTGDFLAIDRFNFAPDCLECPEVEDIYIADQGKPWQEAAAAPRRYDVLGAAELSADPKMAPLDPAGHRVIAGHEGPGQAPEVWLTQRISWEPYRLLDRLRLRLDGRGDGWGVVCFFKPDEEEPADYRLIPLNEEVRLVFPDQTRYFAVGVKPGREPLEISQLHLLRNLEEKETEQ